jgi:microcystin degradation protein MlrC
MKKIAHLLTICLLASLAGFGVSAQPQPKPLPRIGIAGIAIENSTFHPLRTDAMRSTEGPALMPDYVRPGSAMGDAAVWLPAARGGGGSGLVTREAYETFVGRALDIIKANMPYDAFWFYIHGACSVEGLDDPEGEFLERIRGIIGHDALVSTTMDLHGNVSWRLALYSDLITTYRTAPHDDAVESTRRGVENLMARLANGKGRPAYKAWVAVPILLPGERTSTRVEPAKSLYALVPEVEAMPGVIDAGIWIGYAWADERRNQGIVMVVGDDKEQVASGAKRLAQKFWDVRHKFDFEAPTYPLDKCLDLALASNKKPFFISDMGDNPSGGGAGDVTWTLARLLKRPELQSPSGKKLLYMSIPGPEMLEAARKAGVGGHAEAMVGAMVDNLHEGPVKLSGKVVYVSPEGSQATQAAPAGQPRPVQLPARQQGAQAPRDAGLNMAIIQSGSVYVVVTQGPRSFQSDRELIAAGVNPKDMDIVMVKQGYLVNVWYNMQADWVMAHTRGGVDQDLVGLPYKRVIRPIYPLDPDMPDPELNVIFVPSAKHFYGR